MRRWTWWTLALGASMGLFGGLWLAPRLMAQSRIADITSPDSAERSAAWNWLSDPPPGGRTPRLADWQQDIELQLQANKHDAALLDAMAMLEAHGRFGWRHTRPDLMQDTINALRRAGGDHAQTARALLAARPMLPSHTKAGTMP
jgi:hypothetical protein